MVLPKQKKKSNSLLELGNFSIFHFERKYIKIKSIFIEFKQN